MGKRPVTIILILILTGLAANTLPEASDYGFTQTGAPTLTPIPIPTQLYFAFGPDHFPPSVNPLTGQPVLDPSRLERRPLAIKISNYPRNVRPQSGLSKADMVFEYYLEQGITRFIAIFYGQDANKAGPVRSGRFFDEHIFRMFQAIFVFSGADDRVMEYFSSLEKPVVSRLVVEHPEDRKRTCRPEVETPLCRDTRISGYNNLFANTDSLSRRVTERGVENSQQDLTGLRFDKYTPAGGNPATSLDFNYTLFNYNRWIFNPASGRFMRLQDTKDARSPSGRTYAPLLDSLTNEVIAADNVIALFVPHMFYLKTATTEMVQINLIGSGKAILFRDGQAFAAQWVREGEGPLYLISPAGSRIPLRPGVTFFQVLGETSVIHQETKDWQFEFQFP